MIMKNYRIIGFAGLLCILFATATSAFTCDDINPKTGLGIISYLKIEHKLSLGRDVITTTRHVRFCKKIRENEQQIPLITNRNYGSIGLLNCTIVNSNGRKDCDDDLIETYLDGVVIRLPSMEVGDSIEYSYQKDIKFPIEDKVWSTTDIYLEAVAPIEEMTLRIEMPKIQNFRYYSSKQEPQVSEEKNKRVYTWEVKNVSYYEAEPLMPPLRHSLSRVSFTSFDSWDEVEEWFEELFKEVMKEQYVEDKVEELTKNAKTEREKIDTIYKWVRDNITYEQFGFTFLSGYKPRDLNDIIRDESGDCKGQTALLVTMLESAGIKAHPAVISYRDINRDVPGPYSFFHTLTYVPDVDGGMWLDSTCYYCPAGYLPVEEQNMYSLILLDGEKGFTPTLTLPPEQTSRTLVFEKDTLSEDGSAIGEVVVTYYGDIPYLYQYLADRIGIDSIKATLEEVMDTALTKKCGDVSIDNFTIDIGDGSLNVNLTFTCKRFATKSGKKLIISSEADDVESLSTFSEAIAKDERRFPIRITHDTIFEGSSIIQLPPCYGIEEFPVEKQIDESFITVISPLEHNSDNNTIESHARIQFHQDEIPAENFANFKEVVSKILEPVSIIVYPQKDEVSEKIQDTEGLINLSTAETEDKVLWKNKIQETENLVEEGKCQRALNELSSLEEEIKNYKPKEVEETEEPVERGEKGEIPDITLVAAIALIALLVAIVLIVRGKSKGK